MSMRLRRLQADYDKLKARCDRSPYLLILGTKGNPPVRYEIQFAVKGLRLDSRNQVVETTDHVAEIVLTSGYPRQAPQCKMLTPVFHPNIDVASICIGDHWAASESLDDLMVRVAEIITFQSYNTKSPLNGEAARWVDENRSLLPIDAVDLWPAEEQKFSVQPGTPEASRPLAPGSTCVNCGASDMRTVLETDSEGRRICRDCVAECPKCTSVLVIGEKLCRKCLRKVAKFVEHGRDAVEHGNAAKGLAFLEAGLREYPSSEDLQEEKRKTAAVVDQISHTMNSLKQAIREHRYFQARELFERLAQMPVQDDELEPAQKIIEARCSKAAALARRGTLEASHNPTLARALLRRSLQVCTDCSDAHDGLKNLDARNEEVPRIETEFLDALTKGRATAARASLSALLQRVSLPSDELPEITAQVSGLDKARTTVRYIVVGIVVAVVLIVVVTAFLIRARAA